MLDRLRELTSHKCSDLNENISILVADEPGPGGANHEYQILVNRRLRLLNKSFQISFQKGEVKDVGINGISDESLLAIVKDRLSSFQDGPFACNDSNWAKKHISLAIAHLKDRTRDRISCGVEGHSEK